MNVYTRLHERAQNACELCAGTADLQVFTVAPYSEESDERSALLCTTCTGQLNDPSTVETEHWRCLNESMWSIEPPVQVLAYRMLTQLSNEDWAVDLKGQMYLSDETLAWAEDLAGGPVIHLDSNGNVLQSGDSVVLIQDLDVKGANFIAKRGTAVRRISLVHDNPEQIEGRVNDQHIVILTKFVKKT